jgi:hypothetical protein
MKEQILALATLVSTTILPTSESATPLLSPIPEYLLVVNQREIILAEESLDLTIRDEEPQASQGFADNVLLALHYLEGEVELPVDWKEIRQPFETSFTLQPDEIFAFHDNVLPEYSKPVVTMNSEFMTYEGYKSVWGLGGNGVCHLASLMNWVASEAGLEVVAPNNHSFAPVPGVPQEYGTSVRSQSSNQNLYITNSLEYPVVFKFVVDSQKVNLILLKG